MGTAAHTLSAALPRRDRWVILLVVVALAALILGFAASAPAFHARGPVTPGDDTTGLAANATSQTTTLDAPADLSEGTGLDDTTNDTTNDEARSAPRRTSDE